MAQRTEEGRTVDRVESRDPLADLALEVEHLRRALASRDVIGQAKGILMERFKITADEAFGLLVQASQHRNVRVAELAFELAETGDWRAPLPEQ
jgi:AmiR/NasT family two-component response regulator